MRSVKVIEPGMYTTVQDHGRFGFLRYGLPPSGAMDQQALGNANALLGNASDCAVLECTGTMPVLSFDEPTTIAIVYPDHHEVRTEKGGVKFSPIENGFRAYISVARGFDVPKVMGSRSTFVSGMLGGVEGRPLQAGDVLKVGQGEARPRFASSLFIEVQPMCKDRLEACPTLRVIPGPEAEWFDCGGLNTFLTQPFSVSSKSDRTGIRLEGEPLSFRHDEQMVSGGLGMGTIQVPPSGKPIIMMADHPTTGGYPRIGNVVEADFSKLAQLRPGDKIRFEEVREPEII